MKLRKNMKTMDMFEEFCQAVTNNPCCLWLKHYFYSPAQISELDYKKFHTKQESLNGLKNLVDDLSSY